MAFLPFEMDGVMPLFDMPSPSLGAFVLPRLRNPHLLTTPGSSDSNNSDSDSDLLVCRRRPRPASPSPPRPCDPAVLDKTARAFAEDIARARAALKDTTLDDVLQQTCNAALDPKQQRKGIVKRAAASVRSSEAWRTRTTRCGCQ